MKARLPLVLALVFATAWIALPIGRGGAWDPYELDTADLARRVSVHAFGAADLAREGDPKSIPTLSDLGMGELPFTWMAFVFRWLGVSDVTGRGAMAVWAVAGAVAWFLLLRRAAGDKAAFFGLVVLVTMPLYVLQGRTMLGDAVTLAAFALAVAGLLLAVLASSRASRAVALLVGVLALAAGFLTRGLLFGVTAPCVSVGLTLLVGGGLLDGSANAQRSRRIAGVALAATGALAGLWFCKVAFPLVDSDAPLVREVGMTLWDTSPNDSTFDRLLRQIGHGLFPWSAILPWALSRALAPGPAGPEGFVRLGCVVAATVAFACGTLVVPWTGALPFLGVAPLAGVVAFALRDLDRGERPSVMAALSCCAAFGLLLVDISREPARMLAPFVLGSATMPSSYDEPTKHAMLAATLLAAPIVLLALWGAPAEGPRSARDARAFLAGRVRDARSSLVGLGRATMSAFHGNLVFFLVVFEAGLVGLAAMLFIGARAGWESVMSLPHVAVRAGTAAWWALPLGLAGAALAWHVASASMTIAIGLTRLGRGGVAGVGVAAAASLLGLSYYPALAGELSPKEVFETYRAARGADDELGLLGASPRAGAFYAGRSVPTFADERAAFEWLEGGGSRRRFLVVKSRDLPKLNALWRGAHRENLPIIDARRSENLLASNQLGGVTNQNPLADVVLDVEPTPARPLATRFLDNLDVLGWEIRDERGRLVDAVVPGRPFKLTFYYRVLDRMGDWHVFVHLDGRSRHNADHPVLGGRYPMPLWQPGDLVRDEVEVTLPPNFGPGEIWVFWGFYQGKTRLRVSEGEHQDNRAIAGRLKVR